MIKIDNITSIEEIIQLSHIDIISLTLEDSNHPTEGTVTIKKALELKSKLSQHTKLCIELNYLCDIDNEKDIIKTATLLRPDYIQLRSSILISIKTIKILAKENIYLIYVSRSSLEHDEEVWWQLPSFNQNTLKVENIYKKYNISQQLEIMTEYDDAWNILKDAQGQYDDELTIKKLKKFMKKYNTFIVFNYSRNNFDEIKSTFNEVNGYTLSLKSAKHWNTPAHTIELEEIVNMFSELKNKD